MLWMLCVCIPFIPFIRFIRVAVPRELQRLLCGFAIEQLYTF